MIVVENELIIYIDIDDTLIFSTDQENIGFYADYYGEQKLVRAHKKHVEFIKTLKKRGYYVIVHSGNGWKWAKEIAIKLGLEKYVDEVKSKSIKYIDDLSCEHWMGQRVYITDEKE